jgi:hypothetical protein
VTLAIGLAALCVCAGALLVYEAVAGQNPLLDSLYDLRLRRLDLAGSIVSISRTRIAPTSSSR